MRLRGISVLLCVIVWIWHAPGLDNVGQVLWPPRSSYLTLLNLFLKRQSPLIGISRRSTYTNGLCSSFACCLFFSGHPAADIWKLIHYMMSSSLPQYARWTLGWQWRAV
ncbi:hypothetical protein TNCV_1457441 [Trichonephila clavipes]|nr:hypothetical protein TNCV_1457441 [Trichonephila clavipes]